MTHHNHYQHPHQCIAMYDPRRSWSSEFWVTSGWGYIWWQLAGTASNQCLPPVEKSQTGKKSETQFGVNLVSAQCELRDKCLKSNPSLQVCLQSHFFSAARRIKWNTLIIDSRAEAKQTFQHFARCHKITFSNYAPSVFFSAIRALYLFLSAQVTNKHQTEKLSFLYLNFPGFTAFWAETWGRREEWEFTQNSFGAISRDFQPHPAGRPSFKTVKTKTRAIFALII